MSELKVIHVMIALLRTHSIWMDFERELSIRSSDFLLAGLYSEPKELIRALFRLFS